MYKATLLCYNIKVIEKIVLISCFSMKSCIIMFNNDDFRNQLLVKNLLQRIVKEITQTKLIKHHTCAYGSRVKSYSNHDSLFWNGLQLEVFQPP